MKIKLIVSVAVLFYLLQFNFASAHNLYLSSIIGKGEYGSKDGSVTEAIFRNPYGIAFDKENNLYIVDSKNNMLKKVTDSKVTTVTGKIDLLDEKGLPVGTFKDGTFKDAKFNEPRNIALNFKGEFILTDTNNNLIRLVSSSKITTLAGTGEVGYKDGKNNISKFNKPTGVDIDKNGNIYIADTGNNIIRMISTKLEVATFAGKYVEKGGYLDGDLQTALFNEPSDICIVGDVFYVVDSGNHAIRKIENGQVTTIAGHVFYGETDNEYGVSDDISMDAKYSKFKFPKAITTLTDGTIVIADTWNKKIKYIDTLGNIKEFKILTKLQDGTTQDFGISGPIDIVELNNKLYVSDIWDNCIYVFDIEITNETEQAVDLSRKVLNKGKITDIPVISDETKVLLPVRKFFEQSGAIVTWISETREAVVKIEDNEYRFQVDNDNIKIVNSTMMVGIKYLNEKYKQDIVYDKTSNTIFAY
ncbi:MAG: hypothetical protein A2Y24_03900 [Clostridiales bacterium GWE2_32_10]|nr:MAG: hypothetical protein A2Y24_03900 [Clostridiales bacterium GWE2_32_10]